jgi:cell division protein FtsW (lipid II flippase)
MFKTGLKLLQLTIFSAIFWFMISGTIPENLYRFQVEEYLLETDNSDIVLGSGSNSDIILHGEKIESEHLKINIDDSSLSFKNISSNHRVDFDNLYISSSKIDKGQILEINRERYEVISYPSIYFLGVSLSLKRLSDGYIFDLGSMTSKTIKFTPPNGDSDLSIAFIKLFYDEIKIPSFSFIGINTPSISLNKKITKSLFDISVITIGISIIILITSLIFKLFIGRKDNKLANLSTYISLSLVALFLSLSTYSLLYLTNPISLYLRANSFDRSITENIKCNGKPIVDIEAVRGFDEMRSPKNITIGYQKYKMEFDRGENYRYKLLLKPKNSFFFHNINKDSQFRISSTSNSNSNLKLDFPKIFSNSTYYPSNVDTTIYISEITNNSRSSKGDIKLKISSSQTYFEKFNLNIFMIFVLINLLIILVPKLNSYSSTYSIIFTLILSQGVVLLNQFSYFYDRYYSLIYTYYENIALGIMFFSFYLLILKNMFKIKKIFLLPRYKLLPNPFTLFKRGSYIELKSSTGFYPVLVVAIVGVLSVLALFFLKRIFLSSIIGTILFLYLSYFIGINIESYREKFDPTKLTLTHYFETNSFSRNKFSTYMSIIMGILGLQFFHGGELGFYFLGSNYQLFEFIKPILLILVIAHLLHTNDSLKFIAASWSIPLIVLLFLAIFLHDQSPFIIFFILFILYTLQLSHYKIPNSYRFNGKLEDIRDSEEQKLISDHYSIKENYSSDSKRWSTKIVRNSIRVSGIKRKKLMLALNIEKPYVNIILFISFITIFYFSANIFFLENYSFSSRVLERVIDWQNHFNSNNYQYLQSFFFAQMGDEIIPPMSMVPQLKDDMVFSLYINRFGFYGVTFGLFLPLVVLFIRTISLKNEGLSRWSYKQLLFLTYLFLVQIGIAVSNVIGITPIMGQPMSGISYSASNLIFFFFSIFALHLWLERENKLFSMEKNQWLKK